MWTLGPPEGSLFGTSTAWLRPHWTCLNGTGPEQPRCGAGGDPAGQVPDAGVRGGPGKRPSCHLLELLLSGRAGRRQRGCPPPPAGPDLPQGGRVEVCPEALGAAGSGDF